MSLGLNTTDRSRKLGILIKSSPGTPMAGNGWEFWLAASAVTNQWHLFLTEAGVLHCLEHPKPTFSRFKLPLAPHLSLLQTLGENGCWSICHRALKNYHIAESIDSSCLSHVYSPDKLNQALNTCTHLIIF